MKAARAVVIMGALALLASCGADGAPTPPAPQPTETGLSVSGEVAFGLAKRGAD
jgi:hypothetical protein